MTADNCPKKPLLKLVEQGLSVAKHIHCTDFGGSVTGNSGLSTCS